MTLPAQSHPVARLIAFALISLLLMPLSHAQPTLDDAAKLVREGKHEEAIKVYDSILASAPGMTAAEAGYRKGLSLRALGRHKEAAACWEELLKPGFANPRQEDALLETAKTCAFDLNQTEKARLVRRQSRPCSRTSQTGGKTEARSEILRRTDGRHDR